MPLAITMDMSHQLLLTDAIDNCIYMYNYGTWNEITYSGNYSLNIPGSIAVDQDENIYVADFLNQRICKIDRNRKVEVLNQISCRKPYGIFVHENSLYTACEEMANIQKMNLNTNQNEKIVEGYKPIAITLDSNGNIFFSENRKIYFYHKKEKRTTLLLDKRIWKSYSFPWLAHIGALVSVAEDKLIFSDTIRNRIYELKISNLEK